MRFTASVVLFAAAATASAKPLVIERSLASITDVLNSVQTSIDGLDTAVKGLTTDAAPVLAASNKLVGTIGSGTTTVQASAGLALFDALGLLAPVEGLMKHAQTLLVDLKGKKDIVQKNGFCQAIGTQISAINDKGNGLINATVSKVPEAYQGIAKGLAQGFADIFDDAQDTFSAGNCVNA